MIRFLNENINKRLLELEGMDKEDRVDETPRNRRLRQISRDTGKFLAIIALGSPEGNWVEVGTSAGYSTTWIGMAAKERGVMLTTYELLDEKITMAKETFELTGLEYTINLVEGDAVTNLENQDKISFCFLDLEKEFYQKCYELIIPKMVSGGILLADNVISHKIELKYFIQNALSDKRVDACILSQGKGLLLIRKI